MNIIDRVKNILVKPKEEWLLINTESTSSSNLVITYLLPLAIVSALASFVGWGIIFSFGTVKLGLYIALFQLIKLVVSIYAVAFIADALAPSFESEKNIDKSTALLVYSATPVLLGGILGIFRELLWLGLLLGAVYSVYLLFLGLPILKKTKDDKTPIYLIVILLSTGVIYWIVGYILSKIFSDTIGVYTLLR